MGVLANPVNDASDIAEKLKALGFEVLYKENLVRRQMHEAIYDFGQKLKAKGGTGVFFYAGHGIQVSDKNYLVPVDAKIRAEFEIPDTTVEADLLLRVIDDAENALNIVVLDACRNNSFKRSFRSSTPGLARMEGGKGTLIAYSTAPGTEALDGAAGERNSPYTKHLLNYMTKTGVPIEQVFKRVRVGVEKDTNGMQTPWETSSLRGDFYFVPEAVSPTKSSLDQQKKPQKLASIEKISIKSNSEIKYKEQPAQTLTPRRNVNDYKLTIYTNPENANINISTLKTPFSNGGKLQPGNYSVEISHDGYASKKQWINIDRTDVELQVTLVPN